MCELCPTTTVASKKQLLYPTQGASQNMDGKTLKHRYSDHLQLDSIFKT